MICGHWFNGYELFTFGIHHETLEVIFIALAIFFLVLPLPYRKEFEGLL
jgi:hypothetical protein